MDVGPGRIVNNFMDPNKKQYVIPVYQRNYEWSEEDCKKLFEDIINASSNLISIFWRINKAYPTSNNKKEWVWRVPFATRSVTIPHEMTEEEILHKLDDLYAKLMDMEEVFLSKVSER